jgi:choline dehydrogenase-like flavoprotein
MEVFTMSYDVIIVGGSYAGLSAAVPLARARKRVLVIDAGQRRNRFAHAAHGFLGQDGRPPARSSATRAPRSRLPDRLLQRRHRRRGHADSRSPWPMARRTWRRG